MDPDVRFPESLPSALDLSESLRATFALDIRSAAGREPVDVSTLQSLVCSFVRAAKERGEPPERVIAKLKALTIGRGDLRYATLQQQQLRDSILRWCLDEYYGPETARNSHTEVERPVRGQSGRSD